MDTIREDGAATRKSSLSSKKGSVTAQTSAQPEPTSRRHHRSRLSSESSCESLTKPTVSSSLKSSSRRVVRDTEASQLSRSSRRRPQTTTSEVPKVRASSRDTLKSSSEDLQLYVNEPRRPRRVKTKERSTDR